MKFILVVLFFSPDLTRYVDFVGAALDTEAACLEQKAAVLKGLSREYRDGYVFAQCVTPRPVSAVEI